MGMKHWRLKRAERKARDAAWSLYLADSLAPGTMAWLKAYEAHEKAINKLGRLGGRP